MSESIVNQEVKNKYLVISGPTATGKTDAAISLAKIINNKLNIRAEVVNFDSLLFYEELNIGTAKPSLEEQQGIKHHLIDICSIKNPLNAARYCELAQPLIQNFWREGIVPILVGGSGFYLNALIEGMYQGGTPPDAIKEKVSSLLKSKGLEAVRAELEKYDEQSFEKIHANDEYRSCRALEFYYHTEKPISEAAKDFEKVKEQKKLGLKRKGLGKVFYLDIPKDEHFEIICRRTKAMLENGLIAEVESLLKSELYSGSEKPLLSIGYKEVLEYLKGHFTNLNDMEERINISTRQLAKAQRTWFNSHPADNQFKTRKEHPLLEKKACDFLIT